MKSDAGSLSQDPFRWRSAILLIGIVGAVLAIFRQFHAAGGVLLGLLLYATNLFLLFEIGRSLLRKDESSRPALLAAFSSSGRLLFLGVSLVLIAIFLGRDVVLGACGGFLIAQVNLQVPKYVRKREGR